MLETIKQSLSKLFSANTILRWAVLLGMFAIVTHFAGVRKEEVQVAFLLLWYAVIATVIASIMTYVYGKINYHEADTDHPELIKAQISIFGYVYTFCGLVILGTYLAQFN